MAVKGKRNITNLVIRMVHDPPLDGWKVNSTSREPYDFALYPQRAPKELNQHQMQALIDEYEQVLIAPQHGRFRVLVQVDGGDDGQ